MSARYPIRIAIACFCSGVLHACALFALAAWSMNHFSQSAQMGASPGVVVMEATFSEPTPPAYTVTFTPPQEQVLILPDRAEAMSRRFVDMPSARVPLEQFLTRDALDHLLAVDANASPDAAPMEKEPVESLAAATATPIQQPLERKLTPHRPTTAQVADIVEAVPPAPQADAGLRTGPSFAGNRPPSYPSMARRNGWQGQVMLRMSISAAGEVVRVEVARSSGYPILDAEAVATVRTWRGTPATLDGHPVETTELLPVRFRLK